MKPNELRIGNWVKNVEDRENTYQSQIVIDDLYVADQVEPIPLTEEWLIKFGFRKVDKKLELNPRLNDSYFIDALDDLIIDLERVDKYYIPWFGDGTSNKLKHVHQLQNLYFALTGEELKT